MSSNDVVWNKHASTWDIVTPPLRPHEEDIAHYDFAIREFCLKPNSSFSGSVLLLGVTRELTALNSIRDAQIIAVDNNIKMIQKLWGGQVNSNAVSVCADWRTLPLAENSFDIVLGDGAFSNLVFPGEYTTVLGNFARSLKQKGLLISRLYVTPMTGNTIENLVAEFSQYRRYNFHAWKWRIAACLAKKSNNYSAQLRDIWKIWTEELKPLISNKKLTEFELAVMETIERYQDSTIEYSFPTLQIVKDYFSKYFECLRVYYGNYELAEYCPIVVLRKI